MTPTPDLYTELLGEDDEVDVYFIIGSDPEDPIVLRVVGLPDHDMAWVH